MEPRPSTPQTGVLLSPAFLLPLSLLLLNDLYLKAAFGNGLTGKLSDFCGLFVFALFWSAFRPNARLAIHIATAIGFVLWKTPLSQPFLDAWNAIVPFPLGRTVDLSDLVALGVLPLSFAASRPRPVPERSRLAAAAVSVLALFAFAATSYRTEIPVDLRFAFEGSRPELLARLEKLGITAFGPWPGSAPDSYELAIPASVCFDQFTAMVTLTEELNRTLIHVREMEHRCPREGDEAEILPRLFEKKVVVPLHLERL
jgi:hypothetical protein